MAAIEDHFSKAGTQQQDTPRPGLLSGLRAALKRVPDEIKYALVLFLASRTALTVIGFMSHDAFHGRDLSQFPHWFDMWNVWDSSWYIDIAMHGYSTATNTVNMANYAYFPFYPAMIRLLELAVRDYTISGVIVSNVCLLIACVYIYRLARLDSDEPTARRAIKYMILFPTAFILSGILTESTFLALSIACFYYARKRRWPISGALGLLTALTRPYGVVIVIPMAYEYLQSKGFKLRDVRPDALCLLLPPMGLSLFSAYNYCLTGDFLAFAHIQSAWGGSFSNPATELAGRLMSGSGDVRFDAILTLISLALLAIYVRKIRLSYVIYGLLLILVPLSTPASAWSMARYVLIVFPLFIIMAKISENREVDQGMTIGLALFQGFLMALWTVWSFYIV